MHKLNCYAMAPRLEEPTSVAEAEKYVGTEVWKYFPEMGEYYHGKVVEIDTLVENDQGTEEEGLFYRVDYDDGDGEHMLWRELSALIKRQHERGWNNKKRKSAEAPHGTASPMDATPAAEQHAPGSKRRRQSVQQRRQHEPADSDVEDADGTDEVPDSADEEYEAPASHKSSSKRGRGKQQLPDSSARNNSRQQQQQRPRAAVGTPEASVERDNDAAATAAGDGVDYHADDDAAEDEQLEEEVPDAATLDRLLREGNNEVVTVRHQGLAGHIKNVQVQNFMCHQNFAIDFGTHVNVISGSNGSGKSAVLQAIQCCLGVKAKDTGRGENMKGFVRTGCHECKVQVTLWNTGEDAYKPRDFGDWLTVERTIKITGVKETATSKVRLLSSTGRVVSQKMEELYAMLDHLNINASNPLAVMTQDTSRNFLCGSVADKKKYDLFMNATMLADMQTNLRKAQGYVNEMKEIMKDIKEDHMKRTKRVKEVQEKLQKLEESAGLLQQRVMFERALCWVAVEDVQQQIAQLKRQLEVVKPKLRSGLERLLEEVDRELNMLHEQEDTLTAEYEANQATQQNFASGMEQLGEDFKRARMEQRQKSSAYQRLKQKLTQVQDELKGLMESTRETNNDRQREFEEQLQRHNQKVAAEQQKMQAAQQEAERHEQQLQQTSAQQQQKEQDLRQLQDRQRAAQNDLNGFQSELHQLQNAKGQKQAMFGPQQAALRALVDRNKRSFDKVPIGPLGMHLTLTNQMWDVAAEVVLGRVLDQWLVHSSKDEQTLRRLASNMNLRVSIIVANFNRPPYNLSGKPGLAPGWQSLRQFVKVEHPEYPHIIDNKLMDLTHYELVVVDEDQGRCTNAVYSSSAGQAVSNAVHVSGKSWKKVRRAVVTINYYADKRPRLSHSFEASLQSLQQLIAVREGECRSLQQQLVVTNRELQQIKRDADALMRASRAAKGHQMRSQHAVQTLQTQVPVLEPIDEEGADDMLAEQQRKLQEQLTTLQISHDKAKSELEQAHTRMEQAKQLMDERNQELEEALTQMNCRTENLDKVAQDLAKVQANKDKCTASLQQVDQEMAALRTKLEQLTQHLEEVRKSALETCDEAAGTQALVDARAAIKKQLIDKMQQRVASGDSRASHLTQQEVNNLVDATYQDQCFAKATATFNRNLQTVERKIASVEENAGGSKEELEHQLGLAEADFRRHNRAFQNCRKILDVTSAAVVKRWDAYYQQFDSVTSTVSQKFMAYMHRRGHAGKVKVESESGELRLLVKINSQAVGAEAAKKMRAVKDLKQLSGGERSFTTVAFILALGEFTESPFRAMDEFDVFMDAINRRIATQTLLEFAREKGHLQFVFLTPQDLQAVEDAKRKLGEGPNGKPLPEGFVKVVQMRPARPS